MKERILHFLSRFTNRRLKLSDGVSTDGGFTLSKPLTAERIERGQREGKAIYQLNNEVGGFEMVDVIRKNDIVMYRLKHTQTGEKFDFTKSAFELFFKPIKEK